MKALLLTLILLSTSCSINKSLKNANIKDLNPTSIASIAPGGFQLLR